MLALNKTTNQIIQLTPSFSSKMLDAINKLDEGQEYAPSNFTDEEESILWRCMNAKTDKTLDKQLNQMIVPHLEEFKFDLYRGVSKSLNHLLECCIKNPGDILTLQRVTSFSEDFEIAKDFASGEYHTNTILQLVGPIEGFNYTKHMLKILSEAPDEEFAGLDKKKHRMDNMNMVQNEQEWMIKSFTRLRAVDIIDGRQGWPSESFMRIYKMEFV